MLQGKVHHPAEFHEAVAIAAWIRRPSLCKVIVATLQHPLGKRIVANRHEVFNPQALCDRTRAQDAFIFFGIIRGRPAIRKRRQHPQRYAEHVVTLLQKHKCRHRGIHSPAHTDCYTLFNHKSFDSVAHPLRMTLL